VFDLPLDEVSSDRNSWFFSLSTTFSSPLSPGRQIVWIVFILLSLPSIYLAYRMQEDTTERSNEGSEAERYELMGGRSTSLELADEVDKRYRSDHSADE